MDKSRWKIRLSPIAGSVDLIRDLGLAGAIILAFAIFALVGPWLGTDPLATDAAAINLPPGSPGHLLGTDNLGRDLLARILSGTRPTFMIAIGPVAIATVVGFALGAIVGFGPRSVSYAIMRLADVALAFPAILLALAVAALLGPSLRNAIVAISIVLVPPITRVTRAAALDVVGRTYLDAGRLSGATRFQIVRDLALPNMVAPTLVYVAALSGLVVIFASGLSFLGAGVQPPTPEWGRMVAEGRALFVINPWPSVVPGAAIFIVSVAFNLAADRLRTRWDPRTLS